MAAPTPGDGSDVPTNVPKLNETQSQGATRVLSLQYQVLDDRPDWPVVKVLVDGLDPFEIVAPGWRGFDPAEMLGDTSPLLPRDNGRRVAIYRCSCGEAGCGVIAAMIVPSPDGHRVSWVDFRDYVGVFSDPVEDSAAEHGGSPWQLPDLHFERKQYLAEVQRATRDRSWETPRRRTARLLEQWLKPLGLVLPPDLPLSWMSPAWNEDGAAIMFEHISSAASANVGLPE